MLFLGSLGFSPCLGPLLRHATLQLVVLDQDTCPVPQVLGVKSCCRQAPKMRSFEYAKYNASLVVLLPIVSSLKSHCQGFNLRLKQLLITLKLWLMIELGLSLQRQLAGVVYTAQGAGACRRSGFLSPLPVIQGRGISICASALHICDGREMWGAMRPTVLR